MWVVTHVLSVVGHVRNGGFRGSQPTKCGLVVYLPSDCRLTTSPFSLIVTHGQTFPHMVEMVIFHGGPSSYHSLTSRYHTFHVFGCGRTLRVDLRDTGDHGPCNPTLYVRIAVPSPILYLSRLYGHDLTTRNP